MILNSLEDLRCGADIANVCLWGHLGFFMKYDSRIIGESKLFEGAAV